ncbi:MAG TPA: acyltransferase family protein, partial [Candidatus Acidoferrum sp.]|nr:acyltransferase family protein [Candidatus Acidoferrum sp.]
MKRLAFLDSLRGLAAVYVALYHMTLLPEPHLLVPHWASAIVLNGGTAVTLFFVVSSFSLCYAMEEVHRNDGPWMFYIRRFFRIAPLFYACIIFYIIRDHYYFQAEHSLTEISASVFFIFNFIP